MPTTADQAEAVRDFIRLLVQIAKEEGDRFRAENGREPTQAEAEEIARQIKRQAELALVMRPRAGTGIYADQTGKAQNAERAEQGEEQGAPAKPAEAKGENDGVQIR